MFQVVRVCVRRQLWRSGTRGPAGSGSGSGNLKPGSGWTRIRQLSSRHGGRDRSCTVDPDLEEEFVFLDCTDPEKDPAQDREPLVQLRPRPPRPPEDQDQDQARRRLRSLQDQLQEFRGVARQEPHPDSLIQFRDVDFPLDESLVAARAQKRRRSGKGQHRVYGTPDEDEPASDSCCSGCGAVLQCCAPRGAGYLPSEKFKALSRDGGLGGATCQRCHLLTHHQRALDLQVSRDQYRDVVRQIRPLRALVLLIVDLLDVPDSVVPDLAGLVGTNKRVVVLGNKVDLLPGDSPGYLRRVRERLARCCRDAGFGDQVADLHLISAKTGYGIETLISSLQRSWRYKGDVYLVGTANAGKSTLFNTLLDSDYCKTRFSEVLHKATISPWPGTTLNLLKFPIMNPTPHRMFRREQRLSGEAEPSQDEQRRLRHFSRQGYLVGSVGRTFRSDLGSGPDEVQFDPDSLAFGENEDGETRRPGPSREPVELTHNELKDAHWLHDTPGILKDRDILALLSEQEVRSVVPTQAIVPRTFVLKPGTSLFVGGLARIDFLQGQKSCWFSVLASGQVPVHVTSLDKADGIYEKHAGRALLGVPAGGAERMKTFPPLVPEDVRLKGRGSLEAAADITLSSAGWVAVTAVEGDEVQLRVHGPEGSGFGLRTPALLPHIVALKGERIHKSAAYRTVRGPGPERGTQRTQPKKRS